jgi:hypothetical protein
LWMAKYIFHVYLTLEWSPWWETGCVWVGVYGV